MCAARGMIHKIKDRYPSANIVPVDYDPGATRVNQENRIKLMLAVAKEKLCEKEKGDGVPLLYTLLRGGHACRNRVNF